MACGLMDHSGTMKQYARNSESRDAMENAYMPRSGEPNSRRRY